jgi:hypothetical protein
VNDNLIIGLRTRKETGSTVQEENDLSLLYHDGYPRLLNINTKKWSLDRRPQDPTIHRRWHPPFHLETGDLDLQWLPLQRGQGPSWGLGLSSWLSPFWAFSAEVPFLSTMVASLGCRPQSGGALPKSCNEVMVSFLSFSLFLVMSQLQDTDMASCISWSNDFSPSVTDFWSFLWIPEAD